MNIRKSPAEQDMALLSFYKGPNVEWGRSLNCRLEGNSYYTLQLLFVVVIVLFCQTSDCVAGDTATGHGVTHFFFSTCMEKLISGFYVNFGMYKLNIILPNASCI